MEKDRKKTAKMEKALKKDHRNGEGHGKRPPKWRRTRKKTTEMEKDMKKTTEMEKDTKKDPEMEKDPKNDH